jgi:hypothetical protein
MTINSHIALAGNLETTMTPKGPYDSFELALGMAMAMKEGDCPIATVVPLIDPIRWVRDTVDELRDGDITFDVGIAEDKTWHLVFTGNIFDGMSFIGPFPTARDAVAFGTDWCDGYNSVEVTQ